MLLIAPLMNPNHDFKDHGLVVGLSVCRQVGGSKPFILIFSEFCAYSTILPYPLHRFFPLLIPGYHFFFCKPIGSFSKMSILYWGFLQ